MYRRQSYCCMPGWFFTRAFKYRTEHVAFHRFKSQSLLQCARRGCGTSLSLLYTTALCPPRRAAGHALASLRSTAVKEGKASPEAGHCRRRTNFKHGRLNGSGWRSRGQRRWPGHRFNAQHARRAGARPAGQHLHLRVGEPPHPQDGTRRRRHDLCRQHTRTPRRPRRPGQVRPPMWHGV